MSWTVEPLNDAARDRFTAQETRKGMAHLEYTSPTSAATAARARAGVATQDELERAKQKLDRYLQRRQLVLAEQLGKMNLSSPANDPTAPATTRARSLASLEELSRPTRSTLPSFNISAGLPGSTKSGDYLSDKVNRILKPSRPRRPLNTVLPKLGESKPGIPYLADLRTAGADHRKHEEKEMVSQMESLSLNESKKQRRDRLKMRLNERRTRFKGTAGGMDVPLPELDDTELPHLPGVGLLHGQRALPRV